MTPTDLSYFLSCPHRAALELSVKLGVRVRPEWDDPLLTALFALGLEHERQYVEALQRPGVSLIDLSKQGERHGAAQRTIEAMQAGADVVVQGALRHGRWYGRPDVLLKVDRPSPAFGAWSYEVADTKLARETRGGTILQLGLYSEMLGAVQALEPAWFLVVTPPAAGLAPGDAAGPSQVIHRYRFADYAAYFRLVKRRFEAAVSLGHERLAREHYPEPVPHCDVCPWSPLCRDRRRKDDHASLVAGITRLQRRELEGRGVATVQAVARLGDPISFKPSRGSLEGYARVRDQARLQIASRRGPLAYELIAPAVPDRPLFRAAEARSADPVGLARLPEPTPGDVFLDLEGDPLAGDAGREYLFGLVTLNDQGQPVYEAHWADGPTAERQAFETVMDLIGERWALFPGMHVYHYAPYEPSAFKRLMGRYATREAALDKLLRGRRFIDLYAVVRQGLRVGVERYSIKNLEPLYAFKRSVELREANRALRLMEQALELAQPDAATPAVRQVVQDYNRDDCLSALSLRSWLEARRAEAVAAGHVPSARPMLQTGELTREPTDDPEGLEALRARLLTGIGDDVARRSLDEAARFQVAYLLDWHRREEKAGWWEYFRLCELPEEDLLDEPQAVAGLEFVAEIGSVRKSFVQRFRYPAQEMEIRQGNKLKAQDQTTFGTVASIDRVRLTIDIEVGRARRDLRPSALFAHDHFGSQVIASALRELGERLAAAGGVSSLPPGPERALLRREPPALATPDDWDPARLGSLLAIQGPPGSGKTSRAATMILDLVRAGRRVGVTATSHKVIRHLLDEVAHAAADAGTPVRLAHKVGKGEAADDEEASAHASVREFVDNEPAQAALVSGGIDVLGGTAWLWARADFAGSVDVLCVDEAGQMALANVLGIARACTSLVLLGDPQQLEQPTKGSHPPGVGISALHHVLDGVETMPPERGWFLPTTWRLPPALCAFTSDVFYDGHLAPMPGLERQTLRGAHAFAGHALSLVEVPHDGNRNVSPEEAEAVAGIVADLLAVGSTWVDRKGVARPMAPGDIRIVAPFNAHVHRIRETLERRLGPAHVPPVGTVDKFQGQEAPVVIYAMATSRPEDAPRGLDFLYSRHRLNVATSRARCAVILVASPLLFDPDCQTPKHMRLVSALCRFRELANLVP